MFPKHFEAVRVCIECFKRQISLSNLTRAEVCRLESKVHAILSFHTKSLRNVVYSFKGFNE